MDMKVYRKTRYQNIYQHIKNKNYVISMSKPVKTSISRIDNKKIATLDEALKIRDNVLIRQQKALEMLHKEDFDTLWDKYIYDCKFIKKQAYNTYNRKEKCYNKHLKNRITIILSKTNKNFWVEYIENLDTTLKNKNYILKTLTTFFNWCICENYLITNPVKGIKKYKVPKSEMKFLIPEQLRRLLSVLEKDIQSNNKKIAYKAYKIKILTIVGFSAGDRVGETRAVRFSSFDKEKRLLDLRNSIDYTPNSKKLVTLPKTSESERIIDISDIVIQAVESYRIFLENIMGFDVKNSDLLFWNYNRKRPYSDTILRKHFYYYCEKANIPRIRMYDLRHTYVATMMSEGKEPYMFSKRIGHKNISTTIDVYGHLSNKVRKELAQSTDKYIQ
ncbi:MAG: site-specific integrase [Bacilli bacterium]|nr:site-specific integrase [Bacilli bacterium]